VRAPKWFVYVVTRELFEFIYAVLCRFLAGVLDGGVSPIFPAYLAITKITAATMSKSTITSTKSPTAKFIPAPMGMLTTAFLQLPPRIIALGIGMMMPQTSAETNLHHPSKEEDRAMGLGL